MAQLPASPSSMQVAALVREGNNDRRLVLTLEQSFSHPQIAARIRPNILLANRVDATLLDLGIDRQQLENIPGLVVPATRYVEPMTPLPERAIDLELNEAFAAWQKHPNSNTSRAALFIIAPTTPTALVRVEESPIESLMVRDS